MDTARLIIEGQSTPSFWLAGDRNMALDEVLLRSASESGVTSLRFYGWQPATLSLGYFQEYVQRGTHSASAACDCVRRASGGGAILHDQELTYCFATPTKSRFGAEARYYEVFHTTLVEVLREQGVPATLHTANESLSDAAFLCFERRASNDITVEGYKVGGSAQRRWKSGLVQHGSILLAKSAYAPELPGLRELASFSMPPESLITAWLKKLSSVLNLEFTPSTLTDKERELADQLRTEKFAQDHWTKRR